MHVRKSSVQTALHDLSALQHIPLVLGRKNKQTKNNRKQIFNTCSDQLKSYTVSSDTGQEDYVADHDSRALAQIFPNAVDKPTQLGLPNMFRTTDFVLHHLRDISLSWLHRVRNPSCSTTAHSAAAEETHAKWKITSTFCSENDTVTSRVCYNMIKYQTWKP